MFKVLFGKKDKECSKPGKGLHHRKQKSQMLILQRLYFLLINSWKKMCWLQLIKEEFLRQKLWLQCFYDLPFDCVCCSHWSLCWASPQWTRRIRENSVDNLFVPFLRRDCSCCCSDDPNIRYSNGLQSKGGKDKSIITENVHKWIFKPNIKANNEAVHKRVLISLNILEFMTNLS